MSETEPIADAPLAPEGAPAARSPFVLIAAVVGAIAIGAATWFLLVAPLLFADDASANDPAAAPGPADTTDDPSIPSDDGAAPVPDDEAVEGLPLVTFEVFLARDPFEPVVPEPVSETAPDPATDTTADGNDNGDNDTADTGNGDDGDDGDNGNDGTANGDPNGTVQPPPGCRGEEDVVCDGRAVSLIEIGDDPDGRLAVVQVDTTIFEVRRGDVFASNFLVQDVTADHVTLVFGDDVITLTVGERVLK